MDQVQNDEFTMLKGLQSFFNVPANLAKITPIADLLAGKLENDGYITMLTTNKAIVDADTKGIADNKETLHTTVSTDVLVLSGPLVNLGRKTHNNILIQQFNWTPSDLARMTGNDLVTNANATISAANTNMVALAPAGVVPAMVITLTNDLASFVLVLNGPEGAIQAKKTAGQNIHDTFPKSRECIELTLKPLMRTNFAKTDADFYHNFLNATQIVHTGIHHLDFFGLIVDSVTGNTLHGVLVRVLNGTTEVANTKTGDKGHFQFKEIPDGTYAVEISRPGYVTQTIANIAVVSGESTKKTFSMVPI